MKLDLLTNSILVMIIDKPAERINKHINVKEC